MRGKTLPIGHRQLNRLFACALLLCATAVSGVSGIPAADAAGYREQVVHDFCARAGCPGGVTPRAGLVADAAGSLYGTSYGGGVGAGTVFQLTYDPATHKWINRVLHKFCLRSGCADGADPQGGLILDGAGSLYGTTTSGGAFNAGTVFKVNYNAGANKWERMVLYSFCAENGCADGEVPQSRLVMDGSGNLYGTTGAGGIGSAPVGIVFELSYDGVAKKWTETVLHSFCSQRNCADGASPQAGLIIDGSGKLYGTTYLGGAQSGGAVFELSFNAATKTWTQTVLHSFCPRCGEGAAPSGLFMDGAGDLYGTTGFGGARNGGTAYRLSFDTGDKGMVSYDAHKLWQALQQWRRSGFRADRRRIGKPVRHHNRCRGREGRDGVSAYLHLGYG
jgi:uncharacterized repeat protein (TIGR03803 family)